MVRSAAAATAVLILSGFVWYQQVLTHTVVPGDTLWDLSEAYYDTPWDWRRIFEANRDKIRDPNLIYPHQVLVIPGREAAVTDVTVDAPPTADPPQQARAGIERTIFYQDTAVMRANVVRSRASDYLAVSRDEVYRAPWLIGLDEELEHVGRLDDFAAGVHATTTPRGYDRVRVHFDGAPPRVGDRFLMYRVARTIEKVGRVVVPTGIVTISDLDPRGAVGIITDEYDRVQLGDYLGPLPTYEVTPGDYAENVVNGPLAMIMGFAGMNEVHDIESIAFLDVGPGQPVTVGDEFDYVNGAAGGIVEGTLQVVGVRDGVASARITDMDDIVFRQGLVVQLARRMR